MTVSKQKRSRDPAATREAILEAAGTLLAKDGPESVSLSQVAQLAKVNRGTAYQHFETREKLVDATLAWVSDRMFRAVFGDPSTIGERRVEEVDPADVNARLTNFAMDNPELCRVWLLQILASPDPSSDPFWREYEGSLARFAKTSLAEPNIDTEVFSVIVLAGNFLWPIWARSHSHNDQERSQLSQRFAKEMLRLSLHGTLNASKLPGIVEQVDGVPPAPLLRAVS